MSLFLFILFIVIIVIAYWIIKKQDIKDLNEKRNSRKHNKK
ncbi:hypothetical protein [Staphylococcus pseudoxylosus]|nr:hypothetical protein [Staphylococcus pseudoxylosus]